MDPTQALEEVREFVSILRRAMMGDSNDAEIEAGHDVADAFEALDDWLTRGGFLPQQWADAKREEVKP